MPCVAESQTGGFANCEVSGFWGGHPFCPQLRCEHRFVGATWSDLASSSRGLWEVEEGRGAKSKLRWETS